MTYLQVINKVKEVLESNPLIQCVKEGSAGDILNETNLTYPMSIISVTQPHQIGNPESIFNFTIFYIDRLSEDNKNFIWNAALKVFADFIAEFEDGYDMYVDTEVKIPVELFTDDYSDSCAGGWINIAINANTSEINKCNKIK